MVADFLIVSGVHCLWSIINESWILLSRRWEKPRADQPDFCNVITNITSYDSIIVLIIVWIVYLLWQLPFIVFFCRALKVNKYPDAIRVTSENTG